MATATALALCAAFIHAGWNTFIKQSADRASSLVVQMAVGGALAAVALPFVGLPGSASLPWMFASAVTHIGYVHALARAYRHGDFSAAYPIARGGGACLAALGGALLLHDDMGLLSWVGIASAAMGLGVIAWSKVGGSALRSASLTAMCIATYTLFDSRGVRASGNGWGYGLMFMCVAAVLLVGVECARGKRAALVVAANEQRWLLLFAGAGMTAAYAMALAAIRLAPVGYVAMLRESSVVIGACIGWVFFHERMAPRRILGSFVVLAGLSILVGSRLGSPTNSQCPKDRHARSVSSRPCQT
ncbi:MAG: DMT family transporter [Acidimicrobiia bacterium]